MAYDALTWLSGTATDPEEDVSATGNGEWKYVGGGRLLVAELRVAGTVSGTSPTLDVKIQTATNSSGGSAADAVSFTQQTASMKDYDLAGSAANVRSFITPTGSPYARIVKTVGGTTPVFNDVSVMLRPPAGGVAAG